MKNKITWILSIFLLCGFLEPVDASVKHAKKEVKEKKPKDPDDHAPGCNCGNRPPKRPKFTFWFNWK